MKQLVYIFTAMLLVFTACSEDDTTHINPVTGDENVTVTFGLSMKNIAYSTEYVPMRADGEETLVLTSNSYRAILLKKFDTYWVVDSLLSLPLTDEPSANIHLSESMPLKPFSLTLRPGEYHLTIITNPGYVAWAPEIFEGSIIDLFDEQNPPMLCGYMTGRPSYPTDGRYYLGAEIFSGHTSFTVEKQEDLHGQAPADLETIDLKRRVGRFRVALHNDPSAGERNFAQTGMAEQIAAEMVATNDVFCNGLDYFGNPYYDPQNPITEMVYCGMTKKIPVEANNSESYFIPSTSARTFAVHFFTQSGRDVEFTMSDIESTIRSGDPYHIYLGDIPGLKIQDNTLNGIIFKPGPLVDDDPYVIEMLLETENGQPVSSATILSPSAEYL